MADEEGEGKEREENRMMEEATQKTEAEREIREKMR